MKKSVHFSLAGLAASMLVACAGGGDAQGKIDGHLNSTLNINPQIETPAQQAIYANKLAWDSMKEAEAAADLAAVQAHAAQQALADKRELSSSAMLFNEAQSRLYAAVKVAQQKHETTKQQAEVARREAETAELRRPHIRLIEVAIEQAEQVLKIHRDATTTTAPSETRAIENLVAKHLTPEQQALLSAHHVLSIAALEEKIVAAKSEVARLYAGIVAAEAAKNEAKKSQEYSLKAKLKAEKEHDAFHQTLERVKAEKFVEQQHQAQTRTAKTLTIGGQSLDLLTEAVGYVIHDAGSQRLKGYNLAYSAAGYLLPLDAYHDEFGQLNSAYTGQTHVGLQTKYNELPSTTIQYQGKSFGVVSEGNLTLTADFGSKKVSGRVTQRFLTGSAKALSDITLEETQIVSTNDVATFSGVAKYDAGQAVTGSYSGVFMGPQASEVVGKIQDGKQHFYEAFAGAKTPLVQDSR